MLHFPYFETFARSFELLPLRQRHGTAAKCVWTVEWRLRRKKQVLNTLKAQQLLFKAIECMHVNFVNKVELNRVFFFFKHASPTLRE